MRVLTLTNLYPNPFQPNRAPFNRQQVRHLAQNHSVQVIAPILWTDEAMARWKGAASLPASRRLTFDGVTVDHPRYFYPPKVLRSWYGHCFRESVRPWFRRALDEFRPDVIFSPWAYPDGWAAVKLGQRAGLPVVIKVHGSDVLLLRQYPRRAAPTRKALQGADGVLAVSHHLRDSLIELGIDPQRIRVVYCGTDTERFRPGPPNEARYRLGLPLGEPTLLFIGNLVPVKGLEVLVAAAALLRREGLRFRTYLVGQGPLRSQLERQIRREGLGDRVRLMGAMPHDQLPDWYRAASLFVLPSYSEGMPNVLLEAAASGVPFVASRVGGIPELARVAAAGLVPAGDAAALATAIRSCLAAPPQPNKDGGLRLPRPHWESAAELANFLEHVRDRLPQEGHENHDHGLPHPAPSCGEGTRRNTPRPRHPLLQP